MCRIRILIFLIATAIVMQNTCPYGWAAKTIFMSSHASICPHCPIKEAYPPEAQNHVKKNLSNINHFFLIHVVEPNNTFQILSPIDGAPTIKSDQFNDVYLEPLLRPPVLSLSS
jgi:hypothetical protein